MRGFFVLLFKSGGVEITRKTVNHDVVIEKLHLDWKDDNVKWLRGTLFASVDERILDIDKWYFKPVDPPWWYLRNKKWFDDRVLDKFDKEYLQRAKRIGLGKVML